VIALVARGDGGADAGDSARATLSLSDYRYFRALSIDLVGRPPTEDEVAAFEKPGFDLTQWIDAHLSGPTYAERVRRIYMDALRLEVAPQFSFLPEQLTLARQVVLGPDGNKIYVYFRHGQRRLDPVTDGDFCLTQEDSGVQFRPSNEDAVGTPHPIAKATLDAKTVVIKPWWLYADYRAKSPVDLVSPTWAKRFPGYQLMPSLLKEPDNKTPTTEIRVCREEAQTTESGAVLATGRIKWKKGDPLPGGRTSKPPLDSPLAREGKVKTVSCTTGTGFVNSAQCGCGFGLERCMPKFAAFIIPIEDPLGPDTPFEVEHETASEWEKLWWTAEVEHFFDRIFEEDRDFREALTARWTEVNGPVAQFYRSLSGATCCGPGAEAGYTQPEELVDPAKVPADLAPVDTATWKPLADRGPRASGFLTMPAFLVKYGSRRARAHVLFSAFLCQDFVASKAKLIPSTEPDLTKRPGCAACHITLEPLAAYFTRVNESDWTWLPEHTFPDKACPGVKSSPTCQRVYDPAFGMLRGGYASLANADAGPAGLGKYLASSPEFAPCVVSNVAESLLGRPLADDEEAFKTSLEKTFVDGGYRMRALVRAIVTSPAYRAVTSKGPS
jgi:hypothetical protein